MKNLRRLSFNLYLENDVPCDSEAASFTMECTNEDKLADILAVLNSKVVNVWALRELALTDGGLLNDEIRRRAWPLLVGATVSGPEGKQPNSAPIVPCSDDFEIIKWDAARSWHLLSAPEREQKNLLDHMRDPSVTARIGSKRRALVDLVNALLMQDAQDMFYYQGLHELASVILTVMCPDVGNDGLNDENAKGSQCEAVDLSLPMAILSRLLKSHWSDLLKGDFSQLETTLQLSLFPLLSKVDPQVHDRLSECSVHPTFFISWIVTWFSHDVHDSDLVKRLFDCFLVSHPLMPVYVTVAMLTHRRNRETVLDEFESSEIYSLVRDLPKRSTPEVWDGHRSVSVTHRDDPFSESDSSTESDTSCSMDDRSRTFASLENTLQSIKKIPNTDRRDASEEDTSSAESITSDGSASIVSFQEIIDLALAYMEHVPPAQIQSLASSYYEPKEIQNFVAQVHKNSILNLPKMKQDWNQYRSLDSLAIVAMGCGHLVDKKRFLKLRLKVRSLELAAFSIFLFTLAAFLQSLYFPSSVNLCGELQATATGIPSSNVQDATPSEIDIGSNVSKPSMLPVCLEPAVPSSAPHMTELTDMLSSASRIVMDNSVSIYVRTHTSEIVAATWNATTNAVMRGLESEPLLDLDVIEPKGSHASTRPVIPKTAPNGTSLCLSNLSWANALVSSRGSMSIVYCLSAAAASEGRL